MPDLIETDPLLQRIRTARAEAPLAGDPLLARIEASRTNNATQQFNSLLSEETVHDTEATMAKVGYPSLRPEPPRVHNTAALDINNQVRILTAQTGLSPEITPFKQEVDRYTSDETPLNPAYASAHPGQAAVWNQATHHPDPAFVKNFQSKTRDLNVVRWLLNRARPTFKEERSAWDDSLHDWTTGQLVVNQPRTNPKTGEPFHYDTPNLKPAPLVNLQGPVDSERGWDLYTRFLGQVGMAKLYRDPQGAVSFFRKGLSDDDRQYWDSLDMTNLVAHFDRHRQYYVSRGRYERLTQQPWQRDPKAPLIIRRDQVTGSALPAHREWKSHSTNVPGTWEWARFVEAPNKSDQGSTVPWTNDFQVEHLTGVSDFARVLLGMSQAANEQYQTALVKEAETGQPGPGGPLLPSKAGSLLTTMLSTFGAVPIVSGPFEAARFAGERVIDWSEQSRDYWLYGNKPVDPRRLGTRAWSWSPESGEHAVPAQASRFFGNVMRGLLADSSPETIDLQEQAKFWLDRYGQSFDRAEREDFLAQTITAGRVYQNFVTRLLTYENPEVSKGWAFLPPAYAYKVMTAPGSDPWYIKGIRSLARAPFYAFGQHDPTMREWGSGFVGAMADDTPSVLATLAMAARPIHRLTNAAGYRGAPPREISTPLDRVSSIDKILGPTNRAAMIDRAHMVDYLAAQLRTLKDPTAARDLINRAVVEATNRGPLDDSMTAAIGAATREIDRVQAAGSKSLSPQARDSIAKLAEPMADLGPTEALFALKGDHVLLNPHESIRYSTAVLKLFDRIENGELDALVGSPAELVKDKVSVEALQAIRAKRVEVLGRYQTAKDILEAIEAKAAEEQPLLSDHHSVTQETLGRLTEEHKAEVLEAVAQVEHIDRDGGTKLSINPEAGSPDHAAIERTIALGTPEAYFKLLSNKPLILKVGGEQLWRECQEILNPRRAPGGPVGYEAATSGTGLIGASQLTLEFRLKEAATLRKELARADLDPLTRRVYEKQLARQDAAIKKAQAAGTHPPGPVLGPEGPSAAGRPAWANLSEEAALAMERRVRDLAIQNPTGLELPRSTADLMRELTLRLQEEVPGLVVDGMLTFDELVAKYLTKFEAGVKARLGSKAVPFELLQDAQLWFSRATELAFGAVPEAAYRAFARRTAASLVQEASVRWFRDVLTPIETPLPARPGGARPVLADIRAKVAGTPTGEPVLLSQAELAALNSYRDVPLSYSKLPEKIAAYKADLAKLKARMDAWEAILPDLKKAKTSLDRWAPLAARGRPLWKDTLEEAPGAPDLTEAEFLARGHELADRLEREFTGRAAPRVTETPEGVTIEPGAPGEAAPAAPQPAPATPRVRQLWSDTYGKALSGKQTWRRSLQNLEEGLLQLYGKKPAEPPEITLIPHRARPFKISKRLGDFIEAELGKPEWDLLRNATEEGFLHEPSRADRTSYRSYRELRRLILQDVDVMARPEQIRAALEKAKLSPEEIDRRMLVHGAQRVSTLDQACMAHLARRSKHWKHALVYALNNEYRTSADNMNAARHQALSLSKFLSFKYNPSEIQDLILQMREGRIHDGSTADYVQRFLYHRLANAFLAGRISADDFLYYVGKDGYYHGVFEGKSKNLLGGITGRFPIPSRFKPLEEHPYEFARKIPEDGFWIAYRDRKNGPIQYITGPSKGATFKTFQEAFDWLNGQTRMALTTEVSINSPWKFAGKEADGLLVDAHKSLSDLSTRMAANDFSARMSRVIARSPWAKHKSQVREGSFERSGDSFLDANGDRWLAMEDKRVPFLRDYYVHENVVQWMYSWNDQLGWVRAATEDLARATGYSNLSDLHLSWNPKKNPLIPFWTWFGEKIVGNYIAPGAIGRHVLPFMGHILALSKVLLSLPSYLKQLTSNWLFNLPAMGLNPFHPSNWAKMSKYTAEGSYSYPVFLETEKRLGAQIRDWAWEALFKNGNIELTSSSFHREIAKAFDKSWKSYEGIQARIERQKKALADELSSSMPDNDLAATLVTHIKTLEEELKGLQVKPQGPWAATGHLVFRGIRELIDFANGHGPMNDMFFSLFGWADQISKYQALRFLVEERGMSVEGALGRIDAFGQNLHRAPAGIKSLANRLGGTKFTTYPYNQAATLYNTITKQPLWTLQMLGTLAGFNMIMRAGKMEDEDEMRELYARSNGYGPQSLASNLLFSLSRVELPLGGFLDMEPVFGIFMPQSPFARAWDKIIMDTGGADNQATAVPKMLARGANALLSRFAGGSVFANLAAYLFTRKGPRGNYISGLDDWIEAAYQTLLPEWTPGLGRDWDFYARGPELDPLTNKPRYSGTFLARRFFNYHDPQEFSSPARLKVAMDAVLSKDGTLGEYYGKLAYYDLLEVKVRQKGAVRDDGSFDLAKVDQIVRDHVAQEGIARAFPGLGPDEIPDPKSEKAIQQILRTITEPRIARTFYHMNLAQMVDAYLVWRQMDERADPAFLGRVESLIGRKLLTRSTEPEMIRRVKSIYDAWEPHKNELPPGAFDRAAAWLLSSARPRE